MKTRTISGQTSTYYYEDGGYSANSSSPLVALISQPKISFRYAYDTRGNIVSEQRGTLTTTYAYDALGQLVRVNDPHENVTWVYNYDRGGNITSKVKYAYTTGALGTAVQTIPYVYGDSNWKDKLTSYNGTAITYDVIGNPVNDGTWTYMWQAGRQLKQMSKSGTTVQFKYDHNGLRVGKEVNGVETKYVLHGKLITHMTAGSDKLHFFYDAQSRPAKVNFNGTMYTYLHNLQGDVVGILDNAGSLVVEYKYDAWGKPLSTTGSLAGALGKMNPFRYRGYVYDEETGVYYLRSRYYSANWGRLINIDYAFGHRNGVLEYNLFLYCKNSPINNIDQDGKDFFSWLSDTWNNFCEGVSMFVSCIELEAGIGLGIGKGARISGMCTAEAYVGADWMRFELSDGNWEVSSGAVVDLEVSLCDQIGFGHSGRLVIDPGEVGAEWEYDHDTYVGIKENGVYRHAEMENKVGFGYSSGCLIGYHIDISFNKTKYDKLRGVDKKSNTMPFERHRLKTFSVKPWNAYNKNRCVLVTK